MKGHVLHLDGKFGGASKVHATMITPNNVKHEIKFKDKPSKPSPTGGISDSKIFRRYPTVSHLNVFDRPAINRFFPNAIYV